MKIFLCAFGIVLLLFIVLNVYLAVKYSHVNPGLRLIGWFYTLFNGFDSMDGLIKYATKPDKAIPRLGKSMEGKVDIKEDIIKREDGSLMSVVIYTPANAEPGAAGLLWIHGGAYAYGAPRRDERFFVPLVMETNTVAVVPDYTRSVEAPYPAAFNDGVNALVWMKEKAKDLGINIKQLFIGGCSAGSGMAAALAQYARNSSLVKIAYQILIYPMLDDRMDTPSMAGNDELIWNERQTALSWQLYLGDLYKTEDVPAYAAPAREEDLSGLPPAYSFIGTLDPLYDETVRYMNKIRESGTEVICDIYEGAPHGFDAIPCKIAKQAKAKFLEEYKKAKEKYFA